MPTPLISIGIIFRDDIRCIERCLKALQPLRDAVPAELVMADTGSTDGSREVAEKYADILIDFPWIDDFAAARNSVMDRASGIWFFTVDTDEYLDEDVSELVAFLCTSEERQEQVAMVNIRNYNTYEMDGDYSDFSAGRILRMSAKVRYKGAIHEHLNFSGDVQAYQLTRTTLHHDGYAGFHNNSEAGRKKAHRNVQMIKKSLEECPESLLLHMQLLEAGSNSSVSDYEGQVRQAVKMVQEKRPGWDQLGPPILRSALYAAERLVMPEWDAWLELAENWFPNSMFTRLDIEYAAFVHDWNIGQEPEHALLRGERYLKALEDYRNGADPMAQVISPLQMATPFSECEIKIHMINGYCTCQQYTRAFELAKDTEYVLLKDEQINKLISALQDIHFRTTLDTASIIMCIWDMVSDPMLPLEKVGLWKSVMVRVSSRTFLCRNLDAERDKENFVRHAYSLYAPLKGKFEVGTAAAIMDMEDRGEMEAALAQVENWSAFSIHALLHALERGVHFPLLEKPMNIEEMDSLATRLAKDLERFLPLALSDMEVSLEDWQAFCWARGLILAAVRAYPWGSKEQDEEQGMALAQRFARMEREFLPRCYAAETLQEGALFVLPPLHRFGWYCIQAFDALDAGNAAGYVHLLREGLNTYEGVKDMVEFLVDNTPELKNPSEELTALAEQIRTILEKFSPSDPAVAALKQSEAYQKVAYLIEGIAPPIVGGLSQ